MLVLTRKTCEEIIIGDHIVVTILKIDRCAVRLGITAAAGVRIDRREVRAKYRTTGAVMIVICECGERIYSPIPACCGMCGRQLGGNGPAILGLTPTQRGMALDYKGRTSEESNDAEVGTCSR